MKQFSGILGRKRRLDNAPTFCLQLGWLPRKANPLDFVLIDMKEKILDFVLSEIAVILFTISTATFLYLTIKISWTLFPLVIIFSLLAGFSCIGWRRLRELSKEKEKQIY